MPADLFLCPRHPGDLRLTPAACAGLWRRGQGADALDAAARCQGCPIGAAHAGAPMAAPEPARPPVLCLGCGAPCGGATGRRMVVSRGICVSCYNRERELATGRYRRHHPPGRGPLPGLTVAVNGRPVAHSAASRVTLALWALRHTPGAVISRPAPQGAPWQLSLFPGLWLRGPRPRAPRRSPADLALPWQQTALDLAACHAG